MEFRQLKYFIIVSEEKSFSRAAIRLYLSQPALSRQIKSLEDELNVPLFSRHPDGLKLTEAGKFFLEQARDIVNRSHAATQLTRERFTENEKPLTIGYIPTILQTFLGEALNRFGQAYPRVTVHPRELHPNDQVKALRDGAIDIAFMGNPPDELEQEFIVRCVKCVPVVALVPETHELARRSSIDLRELETETFIGISEETFPGRNDRIRDTCDRAGFAPDLLPIADSHASMIALVAAGRGVAIMPIEAESLPHPRVRFVPLHRPLYFARSAAVWRKEIPAGSLEKFLTLLFERAEEK
jgi:DNA-binding transcriptional LysR family regulator